MIDEKVLVERLEERKQFHNSMIAYEKNCGTITEEFQQRKAVEVLEHAIEIVNQLAEEHNNGWIACSERLPKYTDDYNFLHHISRKESSYER